MLVKQDGSPYAKAPGSSVLQSVTDPDPLVKVLASVYRVRAWENVDYGKATERQLLFYTGQVIRQSEWDREFSVATIDTISPATGLAAGGAAVTVTGTGFSQDALVKFGGTNATSVVVVNPTKITCVTPAKTAATYDVTVVTASGTATKTGGFTYS
jgi:hypothetical protein